jgi:hypothetical protein
MLVLMFVLGMTGDGIEATSERERNCPDDYPKLIVEVFRPIESERLVPLTGY